MAEEKSKPNVRALQEFRLKGEKIKEGQVVAKSDFSAKQDWQNLLHMAKPRVEETTDAVGKPKATKADKAAMPGA